MDVKISFWKKEWKSILFFLCFLGLECLFIYNCYYNPKYEEIQKAKFENTKEKYEAENYLATRFLSVLGGTIALFAFYLNWKRTNATEETNRITEKNNDNNYRLSQFSKASELLKDKKSLAARLSGIYLFEKIMNTNEEYHWAVIEILSAYVREKRHKSKFIHSEKNHFGKEEKDVFDENYINVFFPVFDKEQIENDPHGFKHILYRKDPIGADIQAIIKVLGNRNRNWESCSEPIKVYKVRGLEEPLTLFEKKWISVRNEFIEDFNLTFNRSKHFLNDKNIHLESIIKAKFGNQLEYVPKVYYTRTELRDSFLCLISQIKKVDLSNTYMYMADFSNLKMDNINFKSSFFLDSHFEFTSLIGSVFSDAILKQTEISSNTFSYSMNYTQMQFADFSRTIFENFTINDSDFDSTCFTNAIFNNSTINNSKFHESSLSQVLSNSGCIIGCIFTQSFSNMELIKTNPLIFISCRFSEKLLDVKINEPKYNEFYKNNSFNYEFEE